ncbi:beta strand repeat-containing protein, partial [Flavobacterium limnosediminis]|uniref:beta strand repeat-containing protein n=1 Tax=Flavobacterium limnosediminis TaxID=1401027 RepID=UPI000558F0AA
MKKNYLLLFLFGFLSFFVNAQAPGNIGVTTTSAPDICNPGESVTLSCNYFQIFQQTGYAVAPITYNPPFGATAGSATNLTIDDRWSGIVDLKGLTPQDFNFCFYNNSYLQCLISTNGVMTFSLAGVIPGGFYTPNSGSTWVNSGPIPYPGAAAAAPFRNSINGVFQDINPAVNNAFAIPNINYYTVGTYPNRAFVVNFANVAQYGCSSDATVGAQTSQLVLYEATNIIDVYVKRRYPCVSWSNGNGLIGVQNQAGTVATSAPGRNGGTWITNNEAWRFTPNGVMMNPTFQWTDNLGNVVGNTQTITVAPNATTTYTVTATYPSCSPSVTYQVTDQTTVNLVNIPAGVPATLYNCQLSPTPASYSWDFTPNGTAIMAPLNPANYVLSYHTTQASAQGTDATIITGSTTNYTTPGTTATTTIWTAVEDLNTGCRKVQSFDLVVRSCTATPVQPPNLVVCDTDGNGTESFNLTQQNTPILGGQNPADYTITYHTTAASADGTNLNSALIPAGAAVGQNQNFVSAGQTIYVRMESVSTPGTFGTTTFQLVVNPRPAITGTMSACIGSTTQLTGAGTPAASNAWTSSDTTVATVNSSGLVTGVAAGTAIITYTDNNGCSNTTTVTINASPTVTLNSPTTCQGGTVTLTAVPGVPGTYNYAWTVPAGVVDPGNVPGFTTTVGGAYGVVITDQVTNCSSLTGAGVVTVNPLPTISGTLSACISSTSQLTGSGIPAAVSPWTSSNSAVATVNASGLVSAVSVGTSTITYTDSNGCSITAIFTVNALPTISGSNVICANGTTQLSGTGTPATSNAWVSSNTTVATVDATGLVTGISAGSAIITYTNNNGCSNTITITVNALPTISGTLSACVGATTQLTGSGTASAVSPWVSSDTAVATVSATGLVTGISAGTTTITYTNNNGCSITATVTINALPTISGTLTACIGATTQLTGTGTPAATNAWTTSNASVATVDAIGLVTGVSAGTATITYVNNNGCSTTATVTINALPTISGTLTACQGATTQLTGSGTAAASNPWTSSNTAVATIDATGLVTGVGAGSATITYTNNNGCSVTATVTINALPTISGTLSACISSTSQLTGSGIPAAVSPWTSSNTAVATVNASGLISAVSVGTSTITYTDSNGCSITAIFTVNALPTVSGSNVICANGTTQLSGTGTPAVSNAWVSSNTTVATVDAAGLVTGISAGTVIIAYTDSNGCSNTITITVNALPTISGTLSACAGSATQLTGSGTPAAAGAWFSSDTAVATVDNTGLVSGLTAGTTTITYTNNNGCLITATVTINALPTISGTLTTCIGATTQLTGTGTPATSNAWATSNASVATVDAAGLVTGVSAGTTTITYVDSNGCSTTTIVDVLSSPTASISISGASTICTGTTTDITISGTPNGTVNYTVNGTAASVVLPASGTVTFTTANLSAQT